jgi:hypothetical protein
MKQMPAPAETQGKKEAPMAKIIEFRVPENFSKPVKWTPAEERGKLIAFPTSQQKKSA